MVRVQYSNATFQSSASTWSTKIFSADEGHLNHYLNETTYGKYQFSVASESEGCSNDGIVTVTMSEAHPNTQKNSYTCYAEKAIRETDASVNYASFDTNGNSKLDQHELQIMFLVAGGESASGINSPGGIWAMATSMYCDKDENGSVKARDGEYWVELDEIQLMGTKSSPYSMNGYSQFGERQGSGSSNTWDATIGIIAHELGHAYFDLPDL